MAIEIVPFTQTGFDRLQGELDHLKKVEKPQVILDIAEARSHGDLKENAEYHAAREKQGIIEAKIRELESNLSRGQVIDNSQEKPDLIKFGAKVTLENEATGEEKIYQLVGDLEANIDQNTISISSPLAKALLGKRVDDLATIKLPKGTFEYVVMDIKYI